MELHFLFTPLSSLLHTPNTARYTPNTFKGSCYGNLPSSHSSIIHSRPEVAIHIVTCIFLQSSKFHFRSVEGSNLAMEPTKLAAAESRKRKRGLNVNKLQSLFITEPDNYKIAWNELKHQIISLNEHARQAVPSVNSQYSYY